MGDIVCSCACLNVHWDETCLLLLLQVLNLALFSGTAVCVVKPAFVVVLCALSRLYLHACFVFVVLCSPNAYYTSCTTVTVSFVIDDVRVSHVSLLQPSPSKTGQFARRFDRNNRTEQQQH